MSCSGMFVDPIEQIFQLLQMFRLLWLYSALYDLTGIGARGPKYPFPEPWRLGLGQIALASPFSVVGGGSETTGTRTNTFWPFMSCSLLV